jgi:hypothetical protein
LKIKGDSFLSKPLATKKKQLSSFGFYSIFIYNFSENFLRRLVFEYPLRLKMGGYLKCFLKSLVYGYGKNSTRGCALFVLNCIFYYMFLGGRGTVSY